MSIVLDGTAGITTPEIVSTGGPLVVNASAPDNSVVVDASGNVGIGTSSPGQKLTIQGPSNQAFLLAQDSTGGTQGIYGADSAAGGAVLGSLSNHPAIFRTNNVERARITSAGDLLVGGTLAFQDTKIGIFGGSALSRLLNCEVSHTTGFGVVGFVNGNGTVGSISMFSNSVTYNTSSDYRLKHDIAPMTGALARVALLNPVTYKWNADNSEDEGFIAHELAEVCPSAVSGEKDAVETYTDEDGVEQTRIKPQGIDTSFLVATLTAAIQELKAINDAQAQTIESLTARVVALENQIV